MQPDLLDLYFVVTFALLAGGVVGVVRFVVWLVRAVRGETVQRRSQRRLDGWAKRAGVR